MQIAGYSGMPLNEPGKFLLRQRPGYLVHRTAVFKENKGGNAPDPVLRGCHLVAAGVELGNNDPTIKFPRHGSNCRSEHHAWAAGW